MKHPLRLTSSAGLALALAFALFSANAAPEDAKPAKAAPAPTSIHLVFEFIEVAHADFSDLLFERPLKSDASELRETIQSWSKEKKATVFETVVIHARSGQRAKAESIAEVTYPKEYDPAKGPATISQVHNLVENPSTAVLPTAFETRNVGVTVEVDPVVSADGKTIDLNMAPEMVRRLDDLVWPNDEVDPRFQCLTPQFYTAKATTQFSLKNGSYGLIGTVRLPAAIDGSRKDPIVLMFVRASAD